MTALVALTTMAGVALAQAPINVTPYYPLKLGSKYNYTDVASGDSFTLAVKEKVQLGATTAFRLARTSNADFDVISNDAQGIRVHTRNFKGVLANYNPPVVFSPANFTLNAVTTTNPNFANPATGNKTIWTTAISAIEDVQVPAGTFAKCLRLELTIKDEKLGTNLAKMNMWLAKDIGMVKRQGQFFGVFYVQQLTSYTVAP
jgi:hypothetical protein